MPIAGVWIDIRFSLPASTIDGAIPVIRTKDAIEAMRSVLAIAAGADGPDTLPPGAQRHRDRDRALGPRAGRRPHRCHRHLRRAAGADPDHRARRAGRPVLARSLRGHRLRCHRRRCPGRRRPAEPGASGPRRSPGRRTAQGAGRIDRHRNGFGGHRHRSRPRRPDLGDGRRRRPHGARHHGGAVRDPWPHRARPS